jgi:hypothetical protein
MIGIPIFTLGSVGTANFQRLDKGDHTNNEPVLSDIHVECPPRLIPTTPHVDMVRSLDG